MSIFSSINERQRLAPVIRTELPNGHFLIHIIVSD